MPIVATCQCGKQYTFKDAVAGRRAKCLVCGQVIQIPGVRQALPPVESQPSETSAGNSAAAPAM
jgi:hypothetical protein